MSAMSAMVNLEIPWINVLSKMDLVTPHEDEGARNGIRGKKDIARYFPLALSLLSVANIGLYHKIFGPRPVSPFR